MKKVKKKNTSARNIDIFPSVARSNIFSPLADVVLYRQLKDESQSLDKWMAEVNNFLTAEDVGWGDVEVLEAQLEQSNVIFPLTAFRCFYW